MARRATNADRPAPAPKRPSSFLTSVGIAFKLILLAGALVGCIWAAVKVEHFVVADREFTLQGPPEPGVPSESFQISGIRHTPEQKIIDVFAADFGRSIYLCPIAERRRYLLAIDWVRDAIVSRVWPDRILVRVHERTPVAFVQVPGRDGAMFYSLVDADGYLLDPQHAGQLALPVLSGFPAKDTEAHRRERVQRFLRLQSELGTLMEQISEIDVSDTENLKLTQDVDGRALTLMVGNQKYAQRYQNFLDNRVEILKRLPAATILDLRLKDRITAVAQADATASAPERRVGGKRR